MLEYKFICSECGCLTVQGFSPSRFGECEECESDRKVFEEKYRKEELEQALSN